MTVPTTTKYKHLNCEVATVIPTMSCIHTDNDYEGAN